MGTEIEVPGFGESVDPTEPGEAATKIGHMVGGVVLGLVILALGAFGFERIANVATGEEGESEDYLPVAGE